MARPLDIVDVAGDPNFKPDLHTPRRDAFVSVVQDRVSHPYLTTTEFAREMGVSDKQVHRWCARWYGPLPPLRKGKSMGYRIHPYMVRVARGWLQTEDRWIREALRTVLAREPRDWVVVVGSSGVTYYTAAEALQGVNQLLPRVAGNKQPVSVLYVGTHQDPAEDGKREEA
jgi:hypothetical protein